MGIDGFQSWLRNTFGSRNRTGRKSRFWFDFDTFIDQNRRKTVRRLFIDLNALFHNVISIVYDVDDEETREIMRENPDIYWTSDDGVFETCAQYIRLLVMIVKPTNLLYLGADGVVTKSKLMQQRERSYATTKLSKPIFDRSQIKPGTEFMNSISQYLKTRLREMVNNSREDWPIKLEFSDASLPGEGEHKIMERMVNKPTRQSNQFKNGIDVIYSPDSDMCLLAMLHSGVNDQVIVMRQRHEWNHLEPEETYRWEYYDATSIKTDLARDFNFNSISDFIMITIFAGNDFLPGLPCTMSDRVDVFNFLVECYKNVFTENRPHLMIGDKIQWGNLLKFLDLFQVYQQVLLTDMANKQLKYEELYVKKDDETEEILEDRRWNVLTESIVGNKDKEVDPLIFQELYVRFVSGIWQSNYIEVNTELMDYDQMPDMIKNYLGGIRWIMSYYKSQDKFVNVDWCYTFHYSPCLLDLIKELEKNHKIPYWEEEPLAPHKKLLSPVEHLLTILPAENLNLLPRIARAIFLEHLPDLYPNNILIDYSFVEFDSEDDLGREIHKAKVLTNFPSLKRIREIYKTIENDPTIQSSMGSKRLWSKKNNKF